MMKTTTTTTAVDAIVSFRLGESDFSQFRAHILKELDAFAIDISNIPLNIGIKHSSNL